MWGQSERRGCQWTLSVDLPYWGPEKNKETPEIPMRAMVSDAHHWTTFWSSPDDVKPSNVTNKGLVEGLQGPDQL